ncbi:MAG: alpha/beta fold hydrolase, partial [Gammaproteobacteria bacterium]
SRVQQLVRQTTRACTYDRAGYGWSDPGPAPRTSGRLASELRTLLARAKVPPPYIVVGHSFGGYNARLFSSFYPDDTVGLVLVDSPHEAQVPNFFQHQIIRMIDRHGLLQQIWTPELARVLSSADVGAIAPLLGFKAKTLRAILGELAAFKDSGNELSASPINPDLPLVVIMHGLRVLPPGLGDQMEREWLQLLRDLAQRQRHGRFVIAEKSAHLVPLEQPELVAEEIRNMVQAYSGNSIHKP